MCTFHTPTVQQYLGRSVGDVVTISIRQENQFWRGTKPDAAKANFDPREVASPIPEDLFLVEAAIAVGVLEDRYAVLLIRFAVRIG